MTKKEQSAERDDAIAKLRETLKPGTTVHTIMRHVSRSGMQREISLTITDTRDGEPWDITYLAARAIGDRIGKRGGIVIGGCGMDMGFAIVYNLASVLFRDGFGCVGERCPSNDHSNEDRDYMAHGTFRPDLAVKLPSGLYDADSQFYKHWHSSGGYALRQRWL
jgi:hypothetical protein